MVNDEKRTLSFFLLKYRKTARINGSDEKLLENLWTNGVTVILLPIKTAVSCF